MERFWFYVFLSVRFVTLPEEDSHLNVKVEIVSTPTYSEECWHQKYEQKERVNNNAKPLLQGKDHKCKCCLVTWLQHIFTFPPFSLNKCFSVCIGGGSPHIFSCTAATRPWGSCSWTTTCPPVTDSLRLSQTSGLSHRAGVPVGEKIREEGYCGQQSVLRYLLQWLD